MSTFFRKLGWLAQRRRKEFELDDELRFHLEEEADDLQARGLPPDRARRDLGNLTLVRESTRAAWSWTLVEQFAQDLRYAFRAMLHNRTFTALAALSLALGIGANTAIYSFMDSILLRSLPVSDPGSLALVGWRMKANRPPAAGARVPTVMYSMSGYSYGEAAKEGETGAILPYPAFTSLQKASGSVFSSLFAFYDNERPLNLLINGHAEVARQVYVSGDYFRGLGVTPAAGRLLSPDDDTAEAPPAIVISSGLSQRRFGGPANAVGQTVRIDNLPFTVVGIAPPEFFGVNAASNPEIFLPLHSLLLMDTGSAWRTDEKTFRDQHYYWIETMGRLRPGVSFAQAQSALRPVFGQWVAGTVTREAERAALPVLELSQGAAGLDRLRRKYSKPLYVLLTMVGLILAIACANTGNLLLARAAARRREMALRLSMGAGRFRVIRQLLTESVLLASIGGAAGILLGFWGIRLLTMLLANGQENFTLRAELNWHVLAVTLAISVVSGTLFGLAPAIQSTRVDLIPALKESRTADPQGHGGRRLFGVGLSHLLVVGQIAMSLLLLVAAGLFARTMANLESVNLGFNRENLLLFTIDARKAGHKDPEIASFYEELRRQITAIPGVRAATMAHSSLIHAGRQLSIFVGATQTSGTRVMNAGPAFFSTLQIPLRLGRGIDEHDQPGSRPVAVVSQKFASRYFASENPVGRHIRLELGEHKRDMEIVGVAADAHYGDLKREIPPVVYMPYNQGAEPPILQMTYTLRTAGDPMLYAKAVRELVQRTDSRIPVHDVMSENTEIDRSINQEIIFARLCTAFALLALVIACVGLYGTMSYKIVRRTGEIGIRMALGAPRAGVIWMVLREVLLMAIVGLALGIQTARLTSDLVNSFLFGMKPNDPVALGVAAATLLAAALAAGFAPARRASRIDPMTALRHE
jgi:predicted permease